MEVNHEEERIDTTLGDLIAALSDSALEVCGDNRIAYLVAGLALNEILKTAHLRPSREDALPSSEARRHHSIEN